MFIKIGKLCTIIYLIYYLWFQDVWGASQIILYLTTFLAVSSVILDVLTKKKLPFKKVNKFIKMYIIFGIYAFLSGIFVSIDKDVFLSSFFRYFSFVALLFSIWYICYQCNDINWLISSLFYCCLLCALTATFFGKPYQVEVIVTTMSAFNNPNTLGVIMVFGIFTLILRYDKFNKNILINCILIMLFLIVILRCGSRKSLFAGAGLFTLWFIEYLNCKESKKLTFKSLLIFICIVCCLSFGIYYITNYYLDSNSFKRLLLLFKGNGTSGRIQLYKFAIDYWETSPLFGIGLDQYKLWCPYGFFSHSTYAELLSCTGIFGCIIFLGTILLFVIDLIKKSFASKNSTYTIRICFFMILIELFLGIGQVFTFSFEHLLMLFCLSFLAENETKNANILNTIERR